MFDESKEGMDRCEMLLEDAVLTRLRDSCFEVFGWKILSRAIFSLISQPKSRSPLFPVFRYQSKTIHV